MIDQTLSKLGLNEKEIQVYLEVYKRGRVSPSTVSKATGINRSTVYSVAKNLKKRGLIDEDFAGAASYLALLDPTNMQIIVDKEKRELKQKETLVSQALAELEELPTSKVREVPKIRYIEDSDLTDYLFLRADEWNKSAASVDNTWWGFQDHTLAKHFKEWIADFWTKRESAKEVQLKLLSNDTKVEQEIKQLRFENRNIKFWKQGLEFTSTTWIVGDYIIMIYTKERPFYLIEIYNPTLSLNLREVFKNIWQDLK